MRKEELFYANLPLMKVVPEVLEHIDATFLLIAADEPWYLTPEGFRCHGCPHEHFSD